MTMTKEVKKAKLGRYTPIPENWNIISAKKGYDHRGNYYWEVEYIEEKE